MVQAGRHQAEEARELRNAMAKEAARGASSRMRLVEEVLSGAGERIVGEEVGEGRDDEGAQCGAVGGRSRGFRHPECWGGSWGKAEVLRDVPTGGREKEWIGGWGGRCLGIVGAGGGWRLVWGGGQGRVRVGTGWGAGGLR